MTKYQNKEATPFLLSKVCPVGILVAYYMETTGVLATRKFSTCHGTVPWTSFLLSSEFIGL
jgi:hypothetical protein